MTKRRSDIAKLVSRAREIWRQSKPYQEVKKRSKIPGKSGWFQCEKCGIETEVIRVDHFVPIGKGPETFEDFGWWLPKLNCSISNYQDICNACHQQKTKEERKNGRLARKKT